MNEISINLKDNTSPIIAQENSNTNLSLCFNANESLKFGKNKKY